MDSTLDVLDDTDLCTLKWFIFCCVTLIKKKGKSLKGEKSAPGPSWLGACAAAAFCLSPRCSFPGRAAEVCGETGHPTVLNAAWEGLPPLLKLSSAAGAQTGQPLGAGSLERTCRDTARQKWWICSPPPSHEWFFARVPGKLSLHPWASVSPETGCSVPRGHGRHMVPPGVPSTLSHRSCTHRFFQRLVSQSPWGCHATLLCQGPRRADSLMARVRP